MTTENSGNNGVLLGKALFFGLVLLLSLMCVFALFCGCAGGQHQTASSDTPATVADVEEVEAMLTATLPRMGDLETWGHGLGLLISVVAPDENNRMVDVGLALFADFGDNTNTNISEALDANLRLIAELTTRVPDLQAVAILSFSESGTANDVSLRRAVAITQTLVTYGVDETVIIYQRIPLAPPAEMPDNPDPGEPGHTL